MNIRPLSLEAYKRLIQVSLRKEPATLWFKHARFLNVHTGLIEQKHIVCSGERIAYIGDKEPLISEQTEIVELDAHQILVPGYIEPHGHSSLVYNPVTWGDFLLTQGTTVSINDNMFILPELGVELSIQFINEYDKRSRHLSLWWARFDTQTELYADGAFKRGMFTLDTMERWLAHPLVVQGGEFSSWPQFLKGDEELTQLVLATRQTYGKRIEGHLPGASVETLNALAAGGLGADHESMTGEDVLKRIRLGLHCALRYSSIRPDLPQILQQLKDAPGLNLSRLMLTNDGSSAFYLKQSGQNQLIKMVIEAGFHYSDAYRMATLNPASYYSLDQDLGSIAPGRLAHFNILNDILEPTPAHVMVDGRWVNSEQSQTSEWLQHYFGKKSFSFHLNVGDLELTDRESGMGMHLINAVISKPYPYSQNDPLDTGEVYVSLVDSQGQWILNSRMKGFTTRLTALASSYTASKDVLLIGKDKEQMLTAFEEMKHIEGGIVALFDDGESIQIPMTLLGNMSTEPMDKLIDWCTHFAEKMKSSGYDFEDPIYTLLFITTTHLPNIRLTPQGIYLVKEREIVSPVTKLDQ